MQTLADWLHRITLGLCLALFAVMFVGQIVVVLMRYVMGIGFLELQDAVIYAFACLVVLTIPLAMRHDRHVRVDVLREHQSPRARRLTDRAGHLVFTLPVFALVAVDAWPLVSASWAIREGSLETGGLPGLFLVKSAVLVMCGLVILLALADLIAGTRDDAG
ncbi:TRAP transporter small permease subunit [Zhengella sp. ZM62]|uniref:TRAP transporter small permease subunit n=1 Tax=Zhengella sedimenti TaxID=3390035 RepID=UPI0039758C7C